MKRLMTLCIVLVGFALIASPALAEVQNVKVSGDVNAAGVYRTNYDLQSANQTSPGALEDNNSILTQARVAIDADLTDNVS
ncbi:MAG: hypothetical protein QGI05_02455, partial [Candidatus Omnitrophota bacterium]|nr:hypothetical protein [Candidatus Omnitrophota bacterium]